MSTSSIIASTGCIKKKHVRAWCLFVLVYWGGGGGGAEGGERESERERALTLLT